MARVVRLSCDDNQDETLDVKPTVTVQEYDIHDDVEPAGKCEASDLMHCSSYTVVCDSDVTVAKSNYEILEPSPEAKSKESSSSLGSKDQFIRTFKTLVDIADEPMQDDIQSLFTSEDEAEEEEDEGSNPITTLVNTSKTLLYSISMKDNDCNVNMTNTDSDWSIKGLVKWL
ncbi:hypothetical protein BdWA1_001205 [Babesia duncani]|uniref:Uncharacterized protein n=1 Tax=Babesia duncani TaxID=323732 RepID=A0AAD9PNP9_9APIC|nr:hypothetical protein BdWA1_001205 [Babesia duncani]